MMRFDDVSGAGFQSKSKYLFGKVNMQIKLVEGDSAGTVTAFYVCIAILSPLFFTHFLILHKLS